MRTIAFALVALAAVALDPARSRAQAALLMEEPYGFFGTVNPTGHNAVYFERICAETPTQLRRCQPGESGVVISRYQGIAGLDWVAIPLLPYLYSTESVADIPERVDRDTVRRMREHYHEERLLELGTNVSPGNFFHGGWNQLVGASYERRIFAFRFQTSAQQDDAFIARMNARGNVSHFNLLFNNCSDFARLVLDFYFPQTFKRSIFPDAGMTTPKQIAFKLVRYARKHPETELKVFVIPQIPGLRRHSSSNKNIAESLSTTAYAVPIALANPYLAGGLLVDYVVRGRFHLIPKHPAVFDPVELQPLTAQTPATDNPDSAGEQALNGADDGRAQGPAAISSHSGLKETSAPHE